MTRSIEDIVALSPVIPVVVVEAVQDAVPLAEALLEGGIGIIEITLRTPQALEAAARVAKAVPGITLGIGSVLDHRQLAAARDAGAHFIVTPGTPPKLGEALARSGLAALPGSGTVSEMLALRDLGFRHMKFFPAEPAGGAAYLKAVSGPISDLRFCPTGGIDAEKAKSYLALPNVPCVGGSWLAPEGLVRARDWAAITKRSAETLAALKP